MDVMRHRWLLPGLIALSVGCRSSTDAPTQFVEVIPDSLTVKAHRLVQLTAVVTDPTNAPVPDAAVTFSSLDTAVATVTASGLLTARAQGVTKIVVEAGSARDSMPLVVIPGGAITVAFLADSVIVGMGETGAPAVEVIQDSQVVPGFPLRWVLSDTTPASVSTDGTVTGKHSGFTWLSVYAGAASDSARVVVYRPYSGSLQAPVTLGGPGGADAIARSGNTLFVTQPGSNTVARFTLPALTPSGTITVGTGPVDVVFNAAGTRAYTANAGNNTFSIIDVVAGTATTYTANATPQRLILSRDGSQLYVGTRIGELRLFSAQTGAPAYSISGVMGYAITGMVYGRDSTKFFLSAGGEFGFFDDNNGNSQQRAISFWADLRDIAISTDGATALVATLAGPLYLVDLGQLRAIDSIPALLTTGVQRTPDGLFFVATSGRHVKVIDPVVRRVVRDFDIPGAQLRHLVIDPAGTILVADSTHSAVQVIR